MQANRAIRLASAREAVEFVEHEVRAVILNRIDSLGVIETTLILIRCDYALSL